MLSRFGIGHSVAGDVFANLGPIIEAVRPWIATGSLVGILGVVSVNQLGNRKVRVDESRVALDARKLQGENDRASDEILTREVRQLRRRLDVQAGRHRRERVEDQAAFKKLLDESEDRHDKCLADRDNLRELVFALRDQVSGLQRIITQNSANAVLAIGGPELSPDVQHAAELVQKLFERPFNADDRDPDPRPRPPNTIPT